MLGLDVDRRDEISVRLGIVGCVIIVGSCLAGALLIPVPPSMLGVGLGYAIAAAFLMRPLGEALAEDLQEVSDS